MEFFFNVINIEYRSKSYLPYISYHQGLYVGRNLIILGLERMTKLKLLGANETQANPYRYKKRRGIDCAYS